MFKETKSKFDPKVRFQHRSFLEKLKAAQEYKRTPKKAPETEQEKILFDLGLDTWWSRTLVGLGILLLVYLVYIPNFLFIKDVKVSGTDGESRDRIVASVKDYFKASPIYAPQRNVMFLKSEELTNYLLAHNPQLQSVIKVTKDLGKLDLAVEIKQEKFELVTSDGNYALYNDGAFSRNLSGVAIEQKPTLIKIHTEAKLELQPDSYFFTKQMASALSKVQNTFPANKSYIIDYFELPVTDPVPTRLENGEQTDEVNLSSSPLAVLIPNELIVHTKAAEKSNTKPFKIYFDASSDIEKAMVNLNALALELTPAQVAALAYIDMRFPDRSFVCQVSSQCAIRKVVAPVLEIQDPKSDEPATTQSLQ